MTCLLRAVGLPTCRPVRWGSAALLGSHEFQNTGSMRTPGHALPICLFCRPEGFMPCLSLTWNNTNDLDANPWLMIQRLFLDVDRKEVAFQFWKQKAVFLCSVPLFPSKAQREFKIPSRHSCHRPASTLGLHKGRLGAVVFHPWFNSVFTQRKRSHRL